MLIHDHLHFDIITTSIVQANRILTLYAQKKSSINICWCFGGSICCFIYLLLSSKSLTKIPTQGKSILNKSLKTHVKTFLKKMRNSNISRRGPICWKIFLDSHLQQTNNRQAYKKANKNKVLRFFTLGTLLISQKNYQSQMETIHLRTLNVNARVF